MITFAAVLWFRLATLFAQDIKPEQSLVIRAAKLFDPVAGRMLENPVIVIKGNKIESVSQGDTAPVSGAIAIDLAGATLLPAGGRP
jgi:imidazolonepropionase-like amidohydrolase